MIRKATPADIGPMAAFLDAHVETSMFLLGNLEAHGTEDATHPHGTAFFLRETGDGITGVFGCTNGGFLMCQLPGLGATEAQTYAHLLKGYTLQGMTGDADQVQVILDALPVPEEAWRLNRVEPLYRMDIGGLASDRTVRPPAEADVPRLTEWFAQYMTETGTAPPGELQEAALRRAEMAVGAPRIRILKRDGNPVAMAAINAKAGQAVQVGGVFVPTALRGQGLGGQVVQALLAEMAGQGATTAILFAASPRAAKTYERIGFARVGGYRIAMLDKAILLGDPR
ncbi:GNAT family N-acetyltransferase [Mameliella sp. CS4]|mgnify:FL=1|uniref:GNAT family N-acetyltransferase n=1 Tax=Mameliella sp. CS4 TaxID=2862329 RepID=UPI001C5E8CD9|nr:GNAT family N-acetyltransferase [Mameliella sp. CS4]MBW4981720.1 GNAT family N-acetyltransferase [Mameliella sp. CS4]